MDVGVEKNESKKKRRYEENDKNIENFEDVLNSINRFILDSLKNKRTLQDSDPFPFSPVGDGHSSDIYSSQYQLLDYDSPQCKLPETQRNALNTLKILCQDSLKNQQLLVEIIMEFRKFDIFY
jgi:hypothetical protein